MSQVEKYNYCQETLAFKGHLEEQYLVLAERLYRIRKDRLWTSNWEYFEDFLSDMHLSPATASKMINIYEKFILQWQIPEQQLLKAGGWSSIAEFLPIVSTKEDAEEALAQASVLKRSDLRKYITEKKTGIPMNKCPHEETYDVTICKNCGERTGNI